MFFRSLKRLIHREFRNNMKSSFCISLEIDIQPAKDWNFVMPKEESNIAISRTTPVT